MLQLIELQIHVSAGSLREKSVFLCCQTLRNVQKLLGGVMYFSFGSRRGSLYIFLSPIFPHSAVIHGLNSGANTHVDVVVLCFWFSISCFMLK